METDSNTLMNQLRQKHEHQVNSQNEANGEHTEGVRMRLRTLLVALLGVSMSACAFASQPVELELDDEDVSQRLSNVSFARRITKPTIRLVMGYGKLSAFITAGSSLLLLVAVMSKAWWRRGARWLAAPALLVTALEAASDAGDAMLAAALRGASEPTRVAAQTAAAGVLVTVEILVWPLTGWNDIVRVAGIGCRWQAVVQFRVLGIMKKMSIMYWYFIAKFFEYNPPQSAEENEKENQLKALPQ